MNCTAWNSVWAKALTNRPSAMPSRAFAIATRTATGQPSPATCQAEQPERDGRGERRLHRRHRAEREP